jgi:hypothetical protein
MIRGIEKTQFTALPVCRMDAHSVRTSRMQGEMKMDDTDKIVAAIFTAEMCGKRTTGYDGYFKVYDTFLDMMRRRREKKAQEERDSAPRPRNRS